MKNIEKLICVLALSVLSQGCLSIPTSSRVVSEYSPPEEVTYKEVLIDEVVPVFKKSGYSDVEISIEAVGRFRMDVKTRVEKSLKKRYFSFGLFPGMASYSDFGDQAYYGAKAFWYNICFAGIPTVSGLLINPFLSATPSENGEKSFISKAAIVGSFRYEGSEVKSVKKENLRSNVKKDKVVIRGISIWEEGGLKTPNKLIISEYGAAERNIRFSVPKNHPFYKELEAFMEDETNEIRMQVSIPKM